MTFWLLQCGPSRTRVQLTQVLRFWVEDTGESADHYMREYMIAVYTSPWKLITPQGVGAKVLKRWVLIEDVHCSIGF